MAGKQKKRSSATKHKTGTARSKRGASSKRSTRATAAPSESLAGAAVASGRIEHIVVLMLENRSFDHIFGYRPGVNGLKGDEFNLLDPTKPESDVNPAFYVSNGAPYPILAGKNGPSHSLKGTNDQIFNSPTGPDAQHPAKNNGFVRNYYQELTFSEKIPNPSNADVRVVMEAFAPVRLPSINALADAFCVCDNWYSEVPGPTQPNRLYMHAATSAGYAYNVWSRKFDVATIYNRLEDAGCTWATYDFDLNEVKTNFSRIDGNAPNFKQFAALKTDVQKDALSHYSFICPRYNNAKEGHGNSQHAPEDARYGDNLIADVYEALRSNDAVWAKTVLIVLYDEHGGFYDHVVSPTQNIPNPDGINSPAPGDQTSYAPKFKFDRLGLRVPAVICSPWVKAGKVDSTRYQHTSVLATLKKMFNLSAFLTRRDASALTFEHIFEELDAPRTDTPKKLPRAPLPKITVSTEHPAHPLNQPLTEDQKTQLVGVYHLTQAAALASSSAEADTTYADELPNTQGGASEFIKARSKKQYGPPGPAGVRPTGRATR
jgi:phospholipase C